MAVPDEVRKPRLISGIMLLTLGGCWLTGSLLLRLVPGADRFVGLIFPLGGAVCWMLMRRIADMPSPQGISHGEVHRLYRRIMWDMLLLELVLIGALVAVMVSHGLGKIIPSIVSIAVGVHFLPMGGAFRLPLYYVLGILLAATGVYGATGLADQQWIIGSVTGGLLLIAGGLISRPANHSARYPS